MCDGRRVPDKRSLDTIDIVRVDLASFLTCFDQRVHEDIAVSIEHELVSVFSGDVSCFGIVREIIVQELGKLIEPDQGR